MQVGDRRYLTLLLFHRIISLVDISRRLLCSASKLEATRFDLSTDLLRVVSEDLVRRYTSLLFFQNTDLRARVQCVLFATHLLFLIDVQARDSHRLQSTLIQTRVALIGEVLQGRCVVERFKHLGIVSVRSSSFISRLENILRLSPTLHTEE